MSQAPHTKRTQLKAISLVLLAGAAALVSGCLVTSVYPFYSPKDMIYEPGLAGRWTKTDDANEHWEFAKAGTNYYQLTYISSSQTNVMEARLFKLQGQMFLDLFAGEKEWEIMPPPIPSHLLLRVYQLTPKVRMTAMNNEWLAKWVEKNPKALRYYMLKMGDKAEDVRVVLTGETSDLQEFVLSQLKTDEAWTEPFELQRNAPSGPSK
jgi:hypothetical protein